MTRTDHAPSAWTNFFWLVLVAQGAAASAVDLIWGTKIALPGLIEGAGVPAPWWSGLAIAAIGVTIVIYLHRKARK